MIEQQLNDETRSTFLQMGLTSYKVTLHKAGKACKEHVLQLIGPIRKLRRKSIIMNTDRVLLKFKIPKSSSSLGKPYSREGSVQLTSS